MTAPAPLPPRRNQFGKLLVPIGLALTLFAGWPAPADGAAPDPRVEEAVAKVEPRLRKLTRGVLTDFLKKLDRAMDEYVELGSKVESADFQELAAVKNVAVLDARLEQIKTYQVSVERA